MKRINVIGTSGSGKSTVARAISERLNYPYIELDNLFWKDDWQETEDEELFAKLSELLKQENWVLDGNYHRSTSLKWENVELVVWVDYSFTRTLFQAIKRASTRAWTKQKLWENSNNRESFSKLFSNDSVLQWTIKSYGPMRKRYLKVMDDPKYAHIKFVQLRSPKETRKFLEELV